MGNLCSTPNANSCDSKPISMKEWLQGINNETITTEIAHWKPTRSCHKNNVIPESNVEYYLYHIRRGNYDNEEEPGHLKYTLKLKANLVQKLISICQYMINGSHLHDSLIEYVDFVICTRNRITDMINSNLSDKEILANFLGFAYVNISEEHALEIDTVCSKCNQGRKMMEAFESLAPEMQERLFKTKYNKITLLALGSALGFYQKLGYKVTESNKDTDTYTMVKELQQQNGAGSKITYKKRQYLVRIGEKNGKYILVKGERKYLNSLR